MKDFDIAKYLREHQMGSYGILNHYVDPKPLKEEAEVGVKKFNDYIRDNYPHINHNLSDNEVQEFLNQRQIKSLPIEDKADLFADYITSQDLGDVVAEDVTPEEVAEIPYEGPEPKLDGFGDEFEQAEVVSEASYQIDWEDLEHTDLAGSGMEIEIDNFIDRTEKTIQFELTNDSTISQLNRENPRQAAAQIRTLIKKLWLEKIRNWKG